MDTGMLLTFHCLLTRQAEQISTIIVRTHTSWGTFVLDFLPTETIMCVRSYGVCQICPTSSAPAASADCGQLHFRATRHDSDPDSRDVSRDVSLWSFMPKIMRFRQLPSFMSNVQDTLESPPSVT